MNWRTLENSISSLGAICESI